MARPHIKTAIDVEPEGVTIDDAVDSASEGVVGCFASFYEVECVSRAIFGDRDTITGLWVVEASERVVKVNLRSRV